MTSFLDVVVTFCHFQDSLKFPFSELGLIGVSKVLNNVRTDGKLSYFDISEAFIW